MFFKDKPDQNDDEEIEDDEQEVLLNRNTSNLTDKSDELELSQ